MIGRAKLGWVQVRFDSFDRLSDVGNFSHGHGIRILSEGVSPRLFLQFDQAVQLKAYSIGSSRAMVPQPRTIMAIASSSPIPRCIR